jgi:hypothetical protein
MYEFVTAFAWMCMIVGFVYICHFSWRVLRFIHSKI